MSGLQYMGGLNNYMFDTSQYGVSTPDESAQSNQQMSSLISLIPYVGPILGAVANFAGTAYQNNKQEEFYNKYMSPAARMAQMRAAGINPNAAAQGISGASAPQMTAATPSNAFGALGEALGNSANTALTAQAIKAGIDKTNAETGLTDSLNVEKQTTNKYLDAMQRQTLQSLVNSNRISEHTANIIAVDDYYHGVEAQAHYVQTLQAIEKTNLEMQNLEQEYFNMLAQEYATMMSASLSEAQIQKVFSDIGVNNAMIEKIGHECRNIDASTAVLEAEYDETQARTNLTKAHTFYQQKINSTWENSGYNMNSDFNGNFYQNVMSGNIGNAQKLMRGMDAYILQQGDSQFHSKSFQQEQWFGLLKTAGNLYGMGLLGNQPTTTSTTTRNYNRKGVVTSATVTETYKR